ncbi:hypothetical protein C7974DRAFT_397885 [Boeremia exigua]|uniref:uncharacterized protein n=1 Tax=Boeremia exigua TaxID=749465 RepID=UPI001E8EB07B|nr:uncharacterized protein C7974DRAFT_397885 [Boeremia exigua]KAH6622215.1 hypothetical protein C7974DRAFT_397885 [Boeremia exigua]
MTCWLVLTRTTCSISAVCANTKERLLFLTSAFRQPSATRPALLGSGLRDTGSMLPQILRRHKADPVQWQYEYCAG